MDVGPVKASPSMPRDPSIGRRFRFSVEKPPNPSNAPQPQSERAREPSLIPGGILGKRHAAFWQWDGTSCWLSTKNNPLARCLGRESRREGGKAKEWDIASVIEGKHEFAGLGALAKHVTGPA